MKSLQRLLCKVQIVNSWIKRVCFKISELPRLPSNGLSSKKVSMLHWCHISPPACEQACKNVHCSKPPKSQILTPPLAARSLLGQGEPGVDGYIMLQCFFSLFLCFCFSERTSWVVEGTFPRRGGGGGEEEGSPPKGFELLEVGRWWGGGEAEWFGLDAGLTPGLAARLPLRLQKYKIQNSKIQNTKYKNTKCKNTKCKNTKYKCKDKPALRTRCRARQVGRQRVLAEPASLPQLHNHLQEGNTNTNKNTNTNTNTIRK